MVGANKGLNIIFRNAEERFPIGYYIMVVIVVAMLALYGLLILTGLTANALFMTAVTNGLNLMATLVFIISALLGFYRSRNLKIRPGIIAFTVSAVMFFAAEAIWTWYNFIEGVVVPYPSLADIFYLIGSISLIAGIFLVTRGLKVKYKGINPIVAGLAVAFSFIMVVAYLLLTDTLSQETISPIILLDLAYPILDVISIVLVVNLLLVSFYRDVFEAQIVLAIGVIAMSISDIFFSISSATGQYYNGSIIDIFFAISYMLIALAISRYVDLTRMDIVVDSLSKFGIKT